MMLAMVSGERVFVHDLVCEEGVEWQVSRWEILGKKRELGVCGGRDMGRARGNKTGAGVWCLARTTKNTCGVSRGDNGCGALSWKRESARLASFKDAESRVRHLCWDRQVGSQPMEANIRPCEYT